MWQKQINKLQRNVTNTPVHIHLDKPVERQKTRADVTSAKSASVYMGGGGGQMCLLLTEPTDSFLSLSLVYGTFTNFSVNHRLLHV